MFKKDEFGFWLVCEECGHFMRVSREEATGGRRVWCENCGVQGDD